MDSEDPFWSEVPFGRWRARWDLISSAAYASYTISGQSLQRGEVLASYSFLAERWGWSRRKVRRFLAALVDRSTLELVRATPKGTVYRVAKFERYQAELGDGAEPEPAGSFLRRGAPGSGGPVFARVDEAGPPPGGGHSKRHPKGHSKGHREGHSLPAGSKRLTGDGGTGGATAAGTASGTGGATKRKKVRRKKDGRSKRGAPPLPEIPTQLATPAFRAAWDARLEERKERGVKAKLVPSQVRSQFQQLVQVAEAFGIDRAIACVQRATAGGHQGVVFPEDLPGNRGRRPNLDQPGLFQPTDTESRGGGRRLE